MTKLLCMETLRAALADACNDEGISIHYTDGLFYCFSSKIALSDQPYTNLTFMNFASFVFRADDGIVFIKSRVPMDEVMTSFEKHGLTCDHV